MDLAGIQLLEADPTVYGEIWVWLLPIYFFSYGQLVLSIAEALTFGLMAMLVLPLSAYLIGMSLTSLLPSLVILLMVNIFGCYTRWQLERHARNLFLEQRKAEQAAQNKSAFLRQFSHNLRQPLQALSCYASVLEATYSDKTHEPGRLMVSKMGSAIDELNNAFNRILDIANLETGQQVPVLTTVDINLLMAALEDQFAPLAEKRGLKLKVKLRRRPPFNIHSDPCILGQVIGNLIDNAIKYTQAGWVYMEAVNIGGNRLKLRVCDSGIGISEEQTRDIFKGFKYCGFDKLPSESLYLILVLSCSLLGAIYNFRNNADALLGISFSEILGYYSLGFITYVIVTGAKYVVLLGNQQFVTNVNPYSIALVGILAGMFFDRFFTFKDRDTEPDVNGEKTL